MAQYIADVTTAALERGLTGQAARQRVTAGNLANVDTPDYRPGRVDFEQQLRAALQRGETPEAIRSLRPQVRTPASAALRRDGNAVDVEAEMAALAETELHYSAMLKLLTRKLLMLKSVATEGGRS